MAAGPCGVRRVRHRAGLRGVGAFAGAAGGGDDVIIERAVGQSGVGGARAGGSGNGSVGASVCEGALDIVAGGSARCDPVERHLRIAWGRGKCGWDRRTERHFGESERRSAIGSVEQIGLVAIPGIAREIGWLAGGT